MSIRAKREIQELLKFFTIKRELYVSEVDAIFRDFKDERFVDDMYSKDDIEVLWKEFNSLIRHRVQQDLETIANMSGLVLEHTLMEAEDTGANISIDLSRTEDVAALERIHNLNTVFLADTSSSSSSHRPTKKLESLRDEHLKLVNERDRLQEENNALRERYTNMQTQCTTLLREKTEANGRISSLETELQSIRSGMNVMQSNKQGNEAELQTLRQQITTLANTLENTKLELLTVSKERDTRLSESKQFQQLKTLMQKKNQQLQDYRNRLQKYEPDSSNTLTTDD